MKFLSFGRETNSQVPLLSICSISSYMALFLYKAMQQEEVWGTSCLSNFQRLQLEELSKKWLQGDDVLWWLVELVVLLMLDIIRTTSATDGQQCYLLVLPISRTSSATYASSATNWQHAPCNKILRTSSATDWQHVPCNKIWGNFIWKILVTITTKFEEIL